MDTEDMRALQAFVFDSLTLKMEQIGSETSEITNMRCVTSQKSEDSFTPRWKPEVTEETSSSQNKM